MKTKLATTLDWLTQEVNGWQLVRLASTILVVNFLSSFFIISLFLSWHIKLPDQLKNIDHMNVLMIFLTVLPETLLEEILFRLPMALAVTRWGKSPKLLLAATGISMVFGFVHGTIYNIFIQGLVGFSYCILFLKAGGYEGKNKKAILTTWIVHSLYDLILILPFSG